MKNQEYFGDYQPIDGKITFLFREAFKDHGRYEYKRVFTKDGTGIYTMLIDKRMNKFYHIKIVKKKVAPKEEKVVDDIKKDILIAFFRWCGHNDTFSDKEVESLKSFSKGATIEIEEEGLIAIDIITKAKMPE